MGFNGGEIKVRSLFSIVNFEGRYYLLSLHSSPKVVRVMHFEVSGSDNLPSQSLLLLIVSVVPCAFLQ